MNGTRFLGMGLLWGAAGLVTGLSGCGAPPDAPGTEPGVGGTTGLAGTGPVTAGTGGGVATSGTGGSGVAVGGAGMGGTPDVGGNGGTDAGVGGTNVGGGAGTGGTGGTGATGGDEGEPPDPGFGPYTCLPLFEEACTPEIEFTNEESDGDAAMFDQVIPDPVATMQDVACTVCSILFRDPSEIPNNRHPSTIRLRIYDFNGVANASPGQGNINFSSRHIANYDEPDDALLEYRGVLVHETAHLYQHYGNGGLGEGMADFVRIRVGLYRPGRRRPGGSWTDPYTTSGFFFSWLAGPCVYHDDGREPHDKDFGYLLNKRIGEEGPDGVPDLFEEVFGEDVDTLWDEYQAAIDD